MTAPDLTDLAAHMRRTAESLDALRRDDTAEYAEELRRMARRVEWMRDLIEEEQEQAA